MNRRTLIKSLAFTGAAGALGIQAARSEEEPADGFAFCTSQIRTSSPSWMQRAAAECASGGWLMDPRSLPSVAAIWSSTFLLSTAPGLICCGLCTSRHPWLSMFPCITLSATTTSSA